ncbi:MAG: type I restriction endonuclease subunit R [Thermoguttaceae bacterium]|nr:type I restriction endonuclease subunit R [Thermoguttaceae bacterium]
MSEYTSVEKPFLEKLRSCGWKIIDHRDCGMSGIPFDPAVSLRESFDDIALKPIFLERIRLLNDWITDRQLEDCYSKLTELSGSLIEANEKAYNLIRKGIPVDKNEKTGELNPTVKIIDFENWENNDFTAINQFRISTPGMVKPFIIPDIVCFVNGLPLIVIECKDIDKAEPLSDAFEQIRRYSNRRKGRSIFEDGSEGKESLFYTNLFNVLTHGTEARFGTITGEFEHFNNWRDIFPEKYKTADTKEGGISQNVLIGGMFNHEILIDILRNFTLFTQAGGSKFKIVCRYQQYRAVGKTIENLLHGNNFKERSGVIWHTQGSGKSLTMIFLIKKMRTIPGLRDYKILMVVDRLELEEQLGETAEKTGEKVVQISNRNELPKLGNNTPNLNIVMLHKFGKNREYSLKQYFEWGIIPEFEVFDTINNSEKILILIDEAHRTQGGDMAQNLMLAFPNATRIGFTGTPLMTERHKKKTSELFFQPANTFVDTYKMDESVADRATVDIKYIGKKTCDEITDREAFEEAYEQAFKNCSEAERQEIQKRYGTMKHYLESEDRVVTVANDLFEHYVKEVLPNGLKAIVVAVSIEAAARYKVVIEKLIAKRLEAERAKPENERDEDLLKLLEILKVRAVISSQENNEKEFIQRARKEGEGRAVRNSFKKDFDVENPQNSDSGIGIFCVCDRLLTGFDAPILQVMYLDKPLKEHNLLQAITRVNRTKRGKTHGLLVDYFGVTKDLQKALGIYSGKNDQIDPKDWDEFCDYFKDIQDEKPELGRRYERIIDFFQQNGLSQTDAFLEQRIDGESTDAIRLEEKRVVEDVIELMSEIAKRTQFDRLVRDYFDRLDLLFNDLDVQRDHWVRAKRLGYLIWRIGFHYQDKTLDLKYASPKVRKLLDDYLRTSGVTEQVGEVSILSDDFPHIQEIYSNSKSKASAMQHSLRRIIKVKLQQNDPMLYVRFNTKLEEIIKHYQDNWELMVAELEKLKDEVEVGRQDNDPRFSSNQIPFYELLKGGLDKNSIPEETDSKLVLLTKKICLDIKNHISVPNFWEKSTLIEELHDSISADLRRSRLFADYEAITVQILLMCRNGFEQMREHLDELAQS